MNESTLPPERQKNSERIQNVQREVAGRLIIGGVIFAILVVGATYLSIVPRGRLQPKAIQPVLESYLVAGRDRSLWGAHRLYSARGIREVNRQSLFVDFEDRGFFKPLRSVDIIEFETWASGAGIEDLTHEASAVARVVYEDGTMAKMEAQMDLELDTWRIRSIDMSKP